MNGIKHLTAVLNPENHGVLNWLSKCHSYEKYYNQSFVRTGSGDD